MQSLLILIDQVITLYIWILIISAVVSWLIFFGIVNMRNRFVTIMVTTLHHMTNPLLAPIRKILPTMTGIDLAPVLLILILMFGRNLLFEFFGYL